MCEVAERKHLYSLSVIETEVGSDVAVVAMRVAAINSDQDDDYDDDGDDPD